MDNNKFLDLLNEVSLLMAETHGQEDLDISLLEFHRLWETNKNNIPLPKGMEINPTTFVCFYNHYLMLRLLQKTARKLDQGESKASKNINNISYLKLVH